MRKILIAISIMFMVTGIYAQQLPFTSQYMFNDYLINPAVGGSLDYIPFSLSVRSQWSGLEGSPKTQFFSAHSKVGKRIGVGGYVFNDVTGPINEQGIQLSYSYHLKLGEESNLSFGLGGMLFSHSISRAKLQFDEPDDNALSNIRQEGYSPDASFGILFYSKKYKIGFSVPQIFQNNLYDSYTTNNQNNLVRHYFLHGEYIFNINEDIDIVPGALIKLVSGAPIQYDINIKGLYKKKYWLGVSYRNQESVVALLGLAYKNLQFGYSYDFTLTDIKGYSSGSHELFLSLKVFTKPNESTKRFD